MLRFRSENNSYVKFQSIVVRTFDFLSAVFKVHFYILLSFLQLFQQYIMPKSGGEGNFSVAF